MSALSPHFRPTVSLNQKTLRKLASGLLVLRPGQWVRDPSTKRSSISDVSSLPLAVSVT